MKKKYSKKALKNILLMARVETMLRKNGIKKIEDIRYDDGRWYVGQIKQDKKLKEKIPNGLGYMIWPDGSSYNGTFLNGKFNDFGEFENAKGIKKIGIWQNDKFLYKQKIDEF